MPRDARRAASTRASPPGAASRPTARATTSKPTCSARRRRFRSSCFPSEPRCPDSRDRRKPARSRPGDRVPSRNRARLASRYRRVRHRGRHFARRHLPHALSPLSSGEGREGLQSRSRCALGVRAARRDPLALAAQRGAHRKSCATRSLSGLRVERHHRHPRSERGVSERARGRADGAHRPGAARGEGRVGVPGRVSRRSTRSR